MRIPAGAEFIDPQPPRTNHFSNVFVFHKASRTFHTDDTICVFNSPGLIMRFFGSQDGQMKFHPTLTGPGLYPTKEAPYQFKKWVQDIINDWDFVNVCTAHNGNAIGNGKELLQKTLDSCEKLFDKISQRNAEGNPSNQNSEGWPQDPKGGVECG
jgi:hypothetical protein